MLRYYCYVWLCTGIALRLLCLIAYLVCFDRGMVSFTTVTVEFGVDCIKRIDAMLYLREKVTLFWLRSVVRMQLQSPGF